MVFHQDGDVGSSVTVAPPLGGAEGVPEGAGRLAPPLTPASRHWPVPAISSHWTLTDHPVIATVRVQHNFASYARRDHDESLDECGLTWMLANGSGLSCLVAEARVNA